MTTRQTTRLSLILPLLLLVVTGGGVLAERSDYESGYLQVELVPGILVSEVNGIYGTTTSDSLPPLYRLFLLPGTDEGTLIDQMVLDTQRIVAAEYCYRSDTPEGTRQMVVAAVGGTITDYLDQGVVPRLHLGEAHYYTTGQGVLVAVLDTGVNFTHPALQGVIASCGYDFVANDADPSDTANGLDDDGDGLTDEGAGHGTMVAGIVHLVAPDAQILPIRVLNDEGGGQTFAVAKGIRYALAHGADVVNMSLGLLHHSDIIANEIEAAHHTGVALVAAAGNDGTDSVQMYPASDSDVFMVAGLDSADIKADFSNYHSKVEVSAPGVGIRAPYYDGAWAIGAGTSFSTPFISGACALILEMEPGSTRAQIRERVRESVVDIYQLPPNEPFTGKLGTGRFDGYQLLLHSALTAGANGSPARTGGASSLRVWPNPAPAGTAIHVAWQGSPSVVPGLRVFDAVGRTVARLRAGDWGSREVRWDGRDEDGYAVPAGTYFLRAASRNSGDSSGVGRSSREGDTAGSLGRVLIIR